MNDAYVCAFVRESTGMPQEMSAQLWKFGVSPWRLPWVCVYGSLFPSLQPGWTGSPGWHDNLLLSAEPSQAPRLLDDSKHPFRNSFSLCSSSWLGTSYVDQTDLTQEPSAFPSSLAQGFPCGALTADGLHLALRGRASPFVGHCAAVLQASWPTNFQGFSYLVDVLGLQTPATTDLPFYRVLGIKLRWPARATACWTTLMAWH